MKIIKENEMVKLPLEESIMHTDSSKGNGHRIILDQAAKLTVFRITALGNNV